LAVAAVLAVLFAIWLYRRSVAGQRASVRWTLLALRLLAVLLAFGAALRPAIVVSRTRRQSAALLMLYDRSRSMVVADSWDNLPRWRALNRTIESAAEQLEALGKKLAIRHFAFDGKLKDLADTSELAREPAGQQTAIGDCLREALRRVPGRVAAVMLFSDGANTAGIPPRSVAQDLKDRAIPLYTVGFGRETAVESARDLAVRSIEAGPTVFEKNKLVVRGELSARGFAGREVIVRLYFDGTVVDRDSIKLTEHEVTMPVELAYVPEKPGEYKVMLEVSEVEPKKGELVLSNNRVSTYVTVLRGGIRVLYLDGGAVSWEAKFIRRALDSSPDIQLDLVLCRKALAEDEQHPLFDNNRYDVFLLREIPSRWLPAAELVRLRDAVQRGAGLAMLGGRRSFGPGGYGHSPLAEVLPVEMSESDRQLEELGEPTPIKVVPTPQGYEHFVMRFGTLARTRKVWSTLAGWPGGSSFRRVKPRALVLAQSPDGTPLIVAWEIGRGRSAAIAGDSTWVWHLQSDAAMRYHRRFWRQLILWLAHKEHEGAERVWAELASRRIRAGQGLEITAGVEDEQGMPVKDAKMVATVTAPDGTKYPVELARYEDEWRGTFWNSEEPGDYRVVVEASKEGEPLGRSPELKFIVYQEDVELRSPAANLELLASMAEQTGGKYIHPEELGDFLEQLGRQDLHLEIERLVRYRLWDNWPFLLFYVAVLTVEWTVRKLRGLV